MEASKEPTLVGGVEPLISQLQLKVTPWGWLMLKATPLGPVIVTPSNKTLETGASGTDQNIPGPWAPEAVEAVILRRVMLVQRGVVAVTGAAVPEAGAKLAGYQLVR